LVANEAQRVPTIEDLREQFARHGQAHALASWEELGPEARASLYEQAARLGPQLERLTAAHAAARSPHGAESSTAASSTADGSTAQAAIAPPVAIELCDSLPGSEREAQARAIGDRILSEGRVGVFLVAGGQGTRLGFPHAKGCFPVGPVSERTLFELQAQKLRGLARRTGRRLPWYIMTSPATDRETREAFESRDFFGLDPADVFIFCQDTVPAFDFEGRLMLEAAGRIFESPDGHGGSLTALASSGALDDMQRRGIDRIYFYQVDNPLVNIADPVYLGFHEQTASEMSCKVVRKIDPDEKVGVLAQLGERLSVVEYSELANEQRYERDEHDQLRYWAGNVAMHLLNVDFVRRVAANAFDLLPYHLSAKKIPTLDSNGQTRIPDAPNGHKLERFVFDALGATERTCVVETSACEEFFPIKNASGVDSPETSRRALVAQYRRWLEAAGIAVPEDIDKIEIDHSVIDGPGDAAAAGFKSLRDAANVVRTARGRDS
jgi:UDP-N-acetylglucosamine/UDP-N-acetylgalactosamine diphosphorylase